MSELRQKQTVSFYQFSLVFISFLQFVSVFHSYLQLYDINSTLYNKGLKLPIIPAGEFTTRAKQGQ